MAHINKPPRTVKRTDSSTMFNRKKAFILCCNYWRKSVSTSQKSLWNAFRYDRESSFNAFLRLNLYRAFNDVGLMAAPPLDV